MSHRNRRIFQPKFFLFLLLIAGVVIGVVFLCNAVKEYITSCRANEILELNVEELTVTPVEEVPVIEEELEGDTATVEPVTISKAASVRNLDPDTEYFVSGASTGGFGYDIRLNNNEQKYTSSPREMHLYLGTASDYTATDGIITFGGNNYRNTFACGTLIPTLENLKSSWSKNVGSLDGHSGTEWTGQPLLVNWSPEVLPTLGVADSFKQMPGFIEVIYPAADGKIYFYDLNSGTATRDPINVGACMLGTASLDPQGRPMLYVGQGAMTKNKKKKDVAYMFAVDLIHNKVVEEFGGVDYFARRESWNAFDSSPLIINDTLICPAESGVIYFFPLNTKYNPSAGTISINVDDRIKYRYSGPGYSEKNTAGKPWYGFEASASVFRHYLYITDNGGYLQCIDLNTLQLLYTVFIGGDADATPVIEEDGNDGTIYIYTASQTSKQDSSLPAGWGVSYVKKINGLTGEVVWTASPDRVSYVGNGSYKSGAAATPHVGRGTISDIVIYAFAGAGIRRDGVGTEEYAYGGKLVAFYKDSGKVAWSVETNGSADYISSPCVMYTEWGNAYMLACDRSGNAVLYSVTSSGAKKCSEVDLGAMIKSTPAAYGNKIVVGTTGQKADGSEAAAKIWCLTVE